MEPEVLAEFDRFCSFRPNCSDIRHWLTERGMPISANATQEWYKATYPVGAEAIRINALTATFQGLELDRVLSFTLAKAVNHLDDITGRINEVQAQEDLGAEELFRILIGLIKEVRNTATEMNEIAMYHERRDLLQEGAGIVIDTLRSTFRDTAFESALEDAIRASMLEVKRHCGDVL